MSRHATSGDYLADRRYAYAEACLSEGDAQGAAEMAEQALEIAPRFAPAWFLLGRAREALHRAGGPVAEHHAALRAYANALDLDPADVQGARLRLAQIGDGAVLDAISPGYVRALFDAYAPRFTRHLVDDLHYRGPALLVEGLDRTPDVPTTLGRVLDLGCGTGLVGEALGDRPSHLTGVDLSPAMLAQAERGRRYDRLVEDDLFAFLAAEPPDSADLVTAADVLIYIGDLTGLLRAAARVLRPGGRLAVTVQSHDGEESRLGEDGRYAHGDGLVRRALREAGLTLQTLHPAAVRCERGVAVPGRIVVAARDEKAASPVD